MTITQSGTTVTVTGYKAGTFACTGGSSTTFTSSAAFTGGASNGFLNRIVVITAGTGVGASALVTASTTSTITCAHGIWLPGSGGAIAARVTPDSTSVIAIAYNYADAIAAVPTYCSWLTSDNLEMVCTQNINIAASSAFGDAEKSLTISTDRYAISSAASSSWFVNGYLNLSGRGVAGGRITMYLVGGTTTIDTLMVGYTHIHGGGILVKRTLNKHMRWNNASSGSCMSFIDSKINNFGVAFRAQDVCAYTSLYGEEITLPETPIVFKGVQVFEGWGVNSPNGQITTGNYGGAGMAGGDIFDLQLYGELRPIAMYFSRTNEDTPYFWRTNFGYYSSSLSTIADWFGAAHTGTIYLGTTINITTHDSADAALGSVKVGLLEGTSANGRIVTAKDATTHVPTFSKFITTDSSGAYTGPWGSGEGIPILYDSLVYSSEYVSSITSYHAGGYILIYTKYGYIQQVQSRGYVYSTGVSETSFLIADPYTVASYATAIAYTGMAWTASAKTLVLTSTHSIQHIYDYMHAKVDYEAGTNDTHVADPITTLDGTNMTLGSAWKITDDGFITWTGKKLNGGTIVYTTAGTYNPIVDTCTLEFSAASGSFDLSSATITGVVTLINTGGGSIDVYLPSGVGYVNTGPNITVHAPVVSQGLAFTGLVAGSQVIVYTTGTQTALYTDSSSGTTSTFSQTRVTDITVDYTILKAGYLPIRVTGVLLQSAVLTTPIQQEVDRTYAASSGLTYGTTATINTSTKIFALTVASTVANWYSFWMEAFIAQSALANVEFPLTSFGPSSVTLKDGYEFDSGTSIAHLSRGGMRYLNASNVLTATWSGFLSVGTMTGLQATYQQVNGSGTTNTASTGIVDQLIQVYGDATHGNFDYTGHMVFKAQADGYDQAESDVYTTYGTLADELYIFSLQPTSNGLATGNPSVTGVTITDHGATPVTWNGKVFSLTITDSAGGTTGTLITRWLRYNYSLGGTFQGKTVFNWHDLTQTDGSKFKTVRGNIWGGAGAAIKGVRVVQNDGTSVHADFDLFTADDGTTYAPPIYQTVAITGLVANSRVQIYDTTSSTELYNAVVTGISHTWTDSVGASASRAIRIRISNCIGATAYNFVEVNAGTCGTTSTTSAVSYIAAQTLDTAYNTNAIDGSTVTGITITPSPSRVSINLAGGSVTWGSIYAYQVYWLYGATGIADEAAFIEAIDTANYILTGFSIKNTNATPLEITGGWGRDSVTLTIAGCMDVAGSTGNMYAEPDHVVAVTTGGSGLTAGEQAQLATAASTPAILGSPAGASVSADIAAVKVDTEGIGGLY